MTEAVVWAITKVDDETAMQAEVAALVKYVDHSFQMREVMKLRKEWEDDRHAKVDDSIARAMKEWDDKHYPRLLQASWGWHPFYHAFVANLLCVDFKSPYPLSHSIVEGSDVQGLVLQQSNVTRVYHVPWSVLLLRCFLKHHAVLPPMVSHPTHGSTVANVTEWSMLAKAADGQGRRAWRLAISYLREEGFLVFAGARPVQSQHQWVAEVDDATQDLLNPSTEWWDELHTWCNSTRFRALQDMAKHDRQTWLKAWVIRDLPTTQQPPLMCYERWLQHREDLDIGYVLADPGMIKFFGML